MRTSTEPQFKLKAPSGLYAKGDRDGAVRYDRWIPSPLIDTWRECAEQGAKACARAAELSLELPWIEEGAVIHVSVRDVELSLARARESWIAAQLHARWAKDLSKAQIEGDWKSNFEEEERRRLSKRGQAVRVDWVGAPAPAWTAVASDAFLFSAHELAEIKAEACLVAELDASMPAAWAEAKALGYALGAECRAARLSTSFRAFHAAAPVALDVGAELVDAAGLALFVDTGSERGFVAAVGRGLRMDIGRAKLFKSEGEAKKSLKSVMGYGSLLTAKLVKARMQVESYKTLFGAASGVDVLDDAKSRAERAELDGELSSARLMALEAIEREKPTQRPARSMGGRL